MTTDIFRCQDVVETFVRVVAVFGDVVERFGRVVKVFVGDVVERFGKVCSLC